jgi:colanic acid/amylovoran biosynthesis glycosyltransferase
MGVDLAKFTFAPHVAAARDLLQILSVGRLTEQKGYEYAIRSVALLRDMTDRELRYTIIGSGELEGTLKQLVADLQIADTVFFAGPQPLNVICSCLQNAHIFLLPSVTAANGFQEGIPVALMEAMASGLPVVTTRHSGIPELVEHGVSGFLAEERETHSLAQYMLKLISNPDLALRVAGQGRTRVEAEFDIQRLNVQLARLFVSGA